ncbi:Tropomyosin domain-containing protein [Dioscorea alata]|uniref:Tropomyosin domain-containing protein n=1 Tax=Dioscorea alata TaxID=55571 RepID=A0ACB7W9I0_DIOAL|nr:Tropomyosin domain-containing protein [Dioscorea alata]
MATDFEQDEIYLYEDVTQHKERTCGGTIPSEVLTRVELDSAYVNEKLLNLEILLMQVENRESNFDGISLGNKDISAESLEMAFEFYTLSGILNSEVKELEKFMAFLQTEVVDAHSRLSCNGCFKESLIEFEEKLCAAQECLNRSQAQIADIKMQTTKLERVLAVGIDANDIVENGLDTSINARWKLQHVEHQGHIFPLYEKSLVKALDLEKKLTVSRNNEEAFKLKLRFAESELYNLEEFFEMVMGRLFLAENTSELLLNTSKELLGKLWNVQLDLDDPLHHECVSRSKLNKIILKSSTGESLSGNHTPISAELDNILTLPVNGLKSNLENTKDECTAPSEVFALREKVRSLEEQLRKCEINLHSTKGSAEEIQQQQKLHCEASEFDHVIQDLRKNVLEIETRAQNAETKCELLTKSNSDLTEVLDIVRSNGEEKANLLERKLRQSDMLLEHAKASFQAMEEQQSLLNSTLIDMENLIADLKAMVAKAESRAEIAESKYNLLTQSNFELNEELSFLRGKLECLEASLHDADEAKIATSRDITNRSKIIANLVMKLASERERLQTQISELTKRNRYLVAKHLKKKDKGSLCANEEGNHCKSVHLKTSEEVLTKTSNAEPQVGHYDLLITEVCH